jgi:hypothetical protein
MAALTPNSARRLRRDLSGEHGAALIIALLLTMLVAAIGAAVVTITNTETMIAAGYRQAHEASHGAEAALERALHDLAIVADWSSVLTAPPGNLVSSFTDGTTAPAAPDGRTLDLVSLTAERQRDSDARDGAGVFGADTPQWRLFAHAPIQDLLPPPRPTLPLYLVVWVADDGGDGDGDPAVDGNRRIVVHAEAFGSVGARRAVEASVARSPDGLLTVRGWQRVP